MTPERWTETTLGQVASESKARFVPSVDDVRPYVALEHIEGGSGRLLSERDSASVQSQKTIFRRSDVLFGKLRPYLRKVTLSAMDGVCSTDILAIRAGERVVPEYLLSVLSADSAIAHAVGTSAGTKMPRTSWKAMSKLPVLLPPLPEQKKIAAILGSVDEAIQATQAVIDQTRKVKQGLLAQLLTRGIGHTRFKKTEIGEIPETWEVATIEDLMLRIIDYRGRSPNKTEKGVPLITAKNVREGYLDPIPAEFIAEDDFNAWMTRGIPSTEDVLFTTEAPLGNVAKVPAYKIALAQRILALCPDETRMTRSWLFWTLLAPQTQKRIGLYATGSTVLGIKQSVLRKILMPVAGMREQEQVGVILDEVQKEIGRLEDQLDVLERVKRGLMQDLLTGRVRVKGAA